MSRVVYIILAIIFLLIGFVMGEQYTKFTELDWCVKTGLFFMDAKGIQIDMNRQAISMALMLYHQRIDRMIATNFSSVGS